MKINKNIFIYCIFFYFFLLLCISISCQAEIIWQVGRMNESDYEFTDSNAKIVEYAIPPDWYTKIEEIDGIWKFPQDIYSFNDNEGRAPQEIRINFEYPEEYYISHLVIFAGVYQYSTQYIEVYRGPEAKKERLLKREKINKAIFAPQIFHILNALKH